MFAFQPGEWRGRRPEYATLSLLVNKIELPAKLETVRANLPQVWSMDEQTRQCYERRIRMILPVAKLFLIEAFIILRARVSQSVMIWMVGLDQNPAGSIPATSASCDLSNELKCPFRRSEIRQSEASVN